MQNMQKHWEDLVSEKAFAAACDVLRHEWEGRRGAVLDELFRLHRQQPLALTHDVSVWIEELVVRKKVTVQDRGLLLETADRLVWELRRVI
jgi:hypothetical protein